MVLFTFDCFHPDYLFAHDGGKEVARISMDIELENTPMCYRVDWSCNKVSSCYGSLHVAKEAVKDYCFRS